jgi:Rod binding domain-containing protein
METPLMKAAVLPALDLVNAKAPQAGADKASTKEAAKQFEGLLMSMLLQNMRKTVQTSGLFGDDSKSRSTYEYLMDQAVVEHAISSGQGWGLAERLEKAWSAREVDSSKKSPAGT